MSGKLVSGTVSIRGQKYHLSVRLPSEFRSSCAPTSEHLSHDPEISVPLLFGTRWQARPLTIGPNDKPGVHGLGRRLFIGGVESFQVHLITSEFSVNAYVGWAELGSSAP